MNRHPLRSYFVGVIIGTALAVAIVMVLNARGIFLGDWAYIFGGGSAAAGGWAGLLASGR